MNAVDLKTSPGALVSQIRSLTERVEYSAGTRLDDKLELLRLRGRGGMGEVWIARHKLLDIEVAVKVVRADRVSAAAANRLLREARSAARIAHPAIARVMDFGRTAQQEPYIVLELLEGQSLGELLATESRIDAVQAVRMLLPVAHALGVAHHKAIVHRDLKPENIFLSVGDDGRVQPKILDFGIAMSPGSDRLSSKRRVHATPQYAAPEQATCPEAIDGRADIWSLCVVLHELVSGVRPSRDEATEARDGAAAESAGGSSISDPELRAIIERGLRTDPDARWASMHELGTALARWLLDQGVQEDVTGTSLKTYWPELAGSTLAAPPVSAQFLRRGAPLFLQSDAATLEFGVPVEADGRVQEPSLLAPRATQPPACSEPNPIELPAALEASCQAWGLSRSTAR
jgi:serine/threonine-protein kinase